MDRREILVANTSTQKRYKINTDATTLAELKVAFDENGIDYHGMDITEGISKIKLIDDASQLPQNVMYKGEPTNNLVILLTNTKKNIASGCPSRKEIYQLIKDNEIQGDIKEEFGDNYTRISTEDLYEFICDNYDFFDEDPEEPEQEEEEDEEPEDKTEGIISEFLYDYTKLLLKNKQTNVATVRLVADVFADLAETLDELADRYQEEASEMPKNDLDNKSNKMIDDIIAGM